MSLHTETHINGSAIGLTNFIKTMKSQKWFAYYTKYTGATNDPSKPRQATMPSQKAAAKNG